MEPLKVGGDLMLKLLRGVEMDTLEQIADDLGPMDFTNADVVRTVSCILESRRLQLFEEGDTVSMAIDE